MAYIPGAGIKKPLNMLENPVYPDIKKVIPETKWSRKYWQVDAGAVMRDTEPLTNFLGDAVLYQSRDYNKNVYGQDSFKSTVNSEFRPPLIDPIEDIYPLSRMPTKIHAIVPRINPATVSECGSNGYLAKNNYNDDIEKHITDRLKSGQTRSTFFCNLEMPQDNSVLPDLETVLPSVSVSSGGIYPTINGPDPNVKLDFRRLQPSGDSRKTTQVRIDGENSKEFMRLDYNNPQVSGSAGTNNLILLDGETMIPEYDYTNPQVSGSAGTNNLILIDGETIIPDYEYKRPQVSGSAGAESSFRANIVDESSVDELLYKQPQVSGTAGMNTPFQADIETSVDDLTYNRPQISGTAGMESHVYINGHNAMENLELETKVDVPVYVTNPGSDDGYRERIDYNNSQDYIGENRPSYSYAVDKQYVYKDRNEMSYQPHFQQPLQAQKAYGQISQSSPIVPNKFQPVPVSLKMDQVRKSKRTYRF